jgi:shikimate kinase
MESATRHLCPIGMMGSGKTTIGKRVSELLDLPMVDSDAVLVSRFGMSISEMFVSHGEEWFRQREREVITELVASPKRSVVSIGGGAIMDPATQEVLSERAVVVWLHASIETLVTRVGAGATRPMLQPNPRVRLLELSALRDPIYRAAADAIVDIDGLSIEQTAELVARIYEAQP